MKIVNWSRDQREQLKSCQEEIERENRSVFRLMSLCGFLISLINYVVQLVVAGEGIPLFQSGLLTAYFSLLIFIDRGILPEGTRLKTSRMYLTQAPVMLLSILLGSVWDPEHQAVTIFLFMMFLPSFLIDSFFRFAFLQLIWSLLLSGLCLAVKKPPILYTDLIHAFEFYISSCTLMFVVSCVRLLSLRRRQETLYNMTHDPDTDCQNRAALFEKAPEYLNEDLLVMIGELDRLTMVNDFYGIHAANAAEKLYIQTMMDIFGADNVYLKKGDEIVYVSTEASLEECLDKVKLCRKQMHAFEFGDNKIPMTCAFGYVTGKAANRVEFSQVIQLAEINLHQAEGSGNDQTLGSAYDQTTFRAAAADSSTSVRPYEIHQLTGLPRLYYFTARSGEMLENVVNLSRRPVIGFIRLTGLREYNDALGYVQGDELIKEMARLLRRAFYSRVLGHITGGQFSVLCYYEEVEPGIRYLCDSLRDFHNGSMAGCKAGFAEYTGSEEVITLVDRARMAQKSIMPYRTKQFCFYDSALDEELHFRKYIVSHLDEAVEKKFLMVYYQPIMRAATGEVCCEEALSRWNDPELGVLMPCRFIPPLEEDALMYRVNLHVIDQVLENFRQRILDGVPVVPVSVNLSRKDFEQCDMVQEIISRVDASGFSRDLIRIEITESAFTRNQELLQREIRRFRENGFEVWLDDFGSEYSTLNLLEEIDFDLIKIDMKFMNNFTGEGKNFVIVNHTIAMAREMGMVTLMEGVETPEQFDFMKKLQCDMVQGYLFDKPNPYSYIAERARNRTGLPFEKTRTCSIKEKAENRMEREEKGGAA